MTKLFQIATSDDKSIFRLDPVWTHSSIAILDNMGDRKVFCKNIWKFFFDFLQTNLFDNDKKHVESSSIEGSNFVIRYGKSDAAFSRASILEWDPSIFVQNYETINCLFKFMNTKLFLCVEDKAEFLEIYLDGLKPLLQHLAVLCCLPFTEDHLQVFLKGRPFYKKLEELETMLITFESDSQNPERYKIFSTILDDPISLKKYSALNLDIFSLRQGKFILQSNISEFVLIPADFFKINEDSPPFSYILETLSSSLELASFLEENEYKDDASFIEKICSWNPSKVPEKVVLFASLFLDTLLHAIPFKEDFQTLTFLQNYLSLFQLYVDNLDKSSLANCCLINTACFFLGKFLLAKSSSVLSFASESTDVQSLVDFLIKSAINLKKH